MSETALYFTALAAAIVVLFILLPFLVSAWNKNFRKGTFSGLVMTGNSLFFRSVFIASGGGSSSVGRVGRANRFFRVDAATGKTGAKITLSDDDWEWEMVTNGVAWLGWTMDGCKLAGITISPPGIRWNNVSLLETLKLPPKTKLTAIRFDTVAGKISITDDAALAHELDCRSLSGEPEMQLLPLKKNHREKHRRGNVQPHYWQFPAAQPAPGQFRFENAAGHVRYQLLQGERAMDKSLSFIDPEWLHDWDETAGLFHPPAAGIVFSSFDRHDPAASLQLTCISADGQVRWKITQEELGLKTAGSSGTLPELRLLFIGVYQALFLFVSSGSKADKAFAVHRASGKTEWLLDL